MTRKHAEPVTHLENVRRGELGVRRTHCKRGHEFTPENTRNRDGRRSCLTCERLRYEQKRQAS